MKKMLAILLVVVTVFGMLAGCSAKKTVDAEGTYLVKTIDGKTVKEYFDEMAQEYGMDIETIAPLMGLEVDTLDEFITIELNKDGKAKLNSVMDDSEEGTWSAEGNMLTITIGNEPQTFEYKDGEFTMDADGMTVVFVKKA